MKKLTVVICLVTGMSQLAEASTKSVERGRAVVSIGGEEVVMKVSGAAARAIYNELNVAVTPFGNFKAAKNGRRIACRKDDDDQFECYLKLEEISGADKHVDDGRLSGDVALRAE
ncbi:MAG: hypothetical protein EOP06_09325 [Proteobacteria bacterium]|nr:MAG: hypothetical protein EOP06_09325 [Pseudomonadota bacterium]